MKANELRIGNYIMFEPFGGAGFEIIQAQELPFKDRNIVEPILLTEEWLLRFGSKKVIDEPRFHEWSVPEYKKWKKSICIEFDKDGCFFTGGEGIYFSKNIQYVHQLQNLYFALTAEELTIKK